MTQREQFEKWWIANTEWRSQPNPMVLGWRIWQAAQSAKDAELQELRENLEKCREYIEQVEQAKFKQIWVDELEMKYKAAKEACGL